MLDVIDAMGAVGVAALVALENLFPPLPSEVVLPLAGFLAGQGKLSLAAVLVAATVGSVVGALVLYWAGAALGRDRMRRIAERLPLMDADDVDRAQGWFDRHGRSAVLVGRLVPGVRSLVSIPAGIARMPLLPFLGYTTLGSAAYNAVLVLLGHQLGQPLDVGREVQRPDQLRRLRPDRRRGARGGPAARPAPPQRPRTGARRHALSDQGLSPRPASR